MNPAKMISSKPIPAAAAALALLGAAAALKAPDKVRGFDLQGFARLPVLDGGRVKPIDSVARNSLLMIRSRQSFQFQDRTVEPDEWLLDVLFRPEVADSQPIFQISDPDVLGLIGLRQGSSKCSSMSGLSCVSFMTLGPRLDEIQRQAQVAHPLDAKQRTRFQSAIVNLFDRLYVYYRLRNSIQPGNGGGLAAEIASLGREGAAARHDSLAQLAYFRPLPPPAGGAPDGWRSVGEALKASGAGRVEPGLEQWARLGLAYEAQDSLAFNRAAADLASFIDAAQPRALAHGEHELAFNRAQPFYSGIVIYLLALLVLFASWLWYPRVLQPTAYALLAAGALVHTAGLVSRILLQGRPPVTNLYSSAIFVGWTAVILGLVVERVYRKGFGTAVAAGAGFASLIVAQNLAADGDTMEMMRAVLDSNFWLATHVTTITIGYSGTFLAGGIAIAYTLRRHLARRLDPAATKVLVSMAYGVVCFALLFSFVGTVLGGIWADQSWGRFWGWDPKENGALLIVLWNAMILHARWGGYVREKGLMAMAIFGNILTSWSWYGVNMLGIGLHSYGFMEKAFWALSAFIASQLLLIGLCLLPPRFWQGRAAAAAGRGEKATGAA